MGDLRAALERATREDSSDTRANFYREFLDAEVHLALQPGQRENPELPLVGVNSLSQLGVVTIRQAGVSVLPVFTDRQSLVAWTDQEIASRSYPTKSLIQLVDEDCWVHLNPNQEFGKEFTPWEISHLRLGPEGIEELIADQRHQPGFEVEVDIDSSVFPELKNKLRPCLESYSEISEGFLISVRQQEAQVASPVLGLKHQGISEERLKALQDEIERYALEHLSPYQELAIVDDLSVGNQHLAELFEGATPFFYRGKSPAEAETPGVFERLRRLMK